MSEKKNRKYRSKLRRHRNSFCRKRRDCDRYKPERLHVTELQKDEVVGENWFDVFVPQSVREEARLSFHQLLEGAYAKRAC